MFVFFKVSLCIQHFTLSHFLMWYIDELIWNFFEIFFGLNETFIFQLNSVGKKFNYSFCNLSNVIASFFSRIYWCTYITQIYKNTKCLAKWLKKFALMLLYKIHLKFELPYPHSSICQLEARIYLVMYCLY